MGENSLAFFCDAHFHLLPSLEAAGVGLLPNERGVTAAHSVEEFLAQEERVQALEKTDCRGKPGNDKGERNLLQSYGLHPQAPFSDERDFSRRLEFLESLLREGRIQAVGECGLDFFTPEFSANRASQEKAFYAQLEIAARHGAPVIVHARKAIQEIFSAAPALKKTPAVVFHSFAGSPMDARSLLSKGVNAYFSFGKPIMNGNKKAIACVRLLPLDRLLLETDAPYQTLKGERATSPAEIADVYQAAFELRSAGSPYEARPSFFEFAAAIEDNFNRAFF